MSLDPHAQRLRRLRRAVALLILALFVDPAGAQYVQPETPGTSTIEGKVLDSHGDGIAGAHVLAHHLSLGKVFTSPPTDKKGGYAITDLPYGYYDLAVDREDGLYLANRVINLAPASTAEVLMTIVPFQPSQASLLRPYPGSDREPVGIAESRLKPKGREFWRSPKGVAIISGIGGAALLAIALGSDSDEDVATEVAPD